MVVDAQWTSHDNCISSNETDFSSSILVPDLSWRGPVFVPLHVLDIEIESDDARIASERLCSPIHDPIIAALHI